MIGHGWSYLYEAGEVGQHQVEHGPGAEGRVQVGEALEHVRHEPLHLTRQHEGAAK